MTKIQIRIDEKVKLALEQFRDERGLSSISDAIAVLLEGEVKKMSEKRGKCPECGSQYEWGPGFFVRRCTHVKPRPDDSYPLIRGEEGEEIGYVDADGAVTLYPGKTAGFKLPRTPIGHWGEFEPVFQDGAYYL